MTGRERIKAAMRYQAVDIAPVQFAYSTVGFYEHGNQLNDLFMRYQGDFQPFSPVELPAPPPECINPDGSYAQEFQDEWGANWACSIFGITGIPVKFPLSDLERVHDYPFPVFPRLSGEKLANEIAATRKHQEHYYALRSVGSIFERMRSLRSDEDVMCDIQLDEPGIHVLADKIAAVVKARIENALLAGADGIQFGDDYGTEHAMILSPEVWRHFFKPRLKELFRPAVESNVDVLVHSCGNITPILGDLAEIGVTAIWPQLPAYDMQWLAGRCKELGLAVAVHSDRANTMTHGTPEQVRALVHREYEVFDMSRGGSWFYIEVDNGFPYENIKALVETVMHYRKAR